VSSNLPISKREERRIKQNKETENFVRDLKDFLDLHGVELVESDSYGLDEEGTTVMEVYYHFNGDNMYLSLENAIKMLNKLRREIK
jgi:hypothetical protein